MKPVLVSGIKPSGRLHLGNYLGMIQNSVALQNSNKYRCFYFLADLHSLTEEFKPEGKSAQLLDVIADYIALGLDPEKSVIFQQSQIPAHSELAWIFNTITPMGEMERMTQYKDKKSLRQAESVNVGLLTYPALMAADILLYSPQVVPVGDDQLQHLELTRTIARKFNKKFGQTFLEPKALMGVVPRVMSLKDPSKKMSKSQPETCLFLDDEPKVVLEKIKRATTDSGTTIFYDPEQKPGIANLLWIWSALTGESLDNAEERFGGKSYAEFKEELAHIVVDHFAPYRIKKADLMNKPGTLKRILKEGSEVAAKVANKKLKEVQKKVGIAL
jgi:tryptophanyl-tRNA synthetase